MKTTRLSLLLRIKDPRDAEAWAEFDSIYRPMLYRFAKARLLTDDEAQDVVQFCMAAIHRHIGHFDYEPRKGRFKGWLRTIVANRVKNLARARRDQPGKSDDFRRQQTRERTPEEEFDQVWMEEHLRTALSQVREDVTEKSFIAFQRYVIDEEPLDQVCGDLKVTKDQLYKIKWRLTRKLRERMTELVGEDE